MIIQKNEKNPYILHSPRHRRHRHRRHTGMRLRKQRQRQTVAHRLGILLPLAGASGIPSVQAFIADGIARFRHTLLLQDEGATRETGIGLLL